MKRALLALLLLALAAWPAQAQYRVVTVCGNVAPFGAQAAGNIAYPTMDTNGIVCTNGAGGGGGGTPAGATYQVQTNAGSGSFGAIPFGTAGQVLTSNGSASAATSP